MAGFRHFDVTYNKILQKSRLFFGNLPFYVVVTVRVLRTATGAHQSNFWNGLRERNRSHVIARRALAGPWPHHRHHRGDDDCACHDVRFHVNAAAGACRRRLPDEFRFLDRGCGQHRKAAGDRRAGLQRRQLLSGRHRLPECALGRLRRIQLLQSRQRHHRSRQAESAAAGIHRPRKPRLPAGSGRRHHRQGRCADRRPQRDRADARRRHQPRRSQDIREAARGRDRQGA